MKVLVMGIAGGLARAVALLLRERGHEVQGIDKRPWRDAPKGIEVHEIDLRKRAAEDVFRRKKPDAVVHMATVTSLLARAEERQRINLGGTRAVFEYSQQYGVKQVVFVGRHTYYGAGPDSPMYHTEEEPPLALDRFPELSDLVAADLYAANALWRSPQLATCVLRLCYTLGPSQQGTLSTFLRGRRVPMVLGFDPLFQFLYEADAAMSIVLAVEKHLKGVFNVAGPSPLPLSQIIAEAGRTPVPLPEVIISALLGRFGFPALPAGAVQHIKFPVVVDARRFFEATGFTPSVDEVETLRRYRALGR
ncbi:MAG: SDR family oxidoreductase [Myxococcaceae bacterium]|nr:SDR family oxidoreductase [Myxococcaceae bacterium]